ncbi:MAG: hypothetical protein RLZZ618_3389 [Pseudomonadota bacterium]|jgi:hypothetical protein
MTAQQSFAKAFDALHSFTALRGLTIHPFPMAPLHG